VSLKDLKFSKLILAALFILTPLLGWLIFGERGLLHLYRAELDRQEYMDRIRSLAEENRAMLAEIERLRSDMKYIEHLARKELNMVKNNETVYRFGEQTRRPAPPGPEATEEDIGAGNDAGSKIPDRQPR